MISFLGSHMPLNVMSSGAQIFSEMVDILLSPFLNKVNEVL